MSHRRMHACAQSTFAQIAEAARSHPAVAVGQGEDLVLLHVSGSPYGGAVHNSSPLDGTFPGKLEEKCADVSARNGCEPCPALPCPPGTFCLLPADGTEGCCFLLSCTFQTPLPGPNTMRGLRA